MLSAANVRNARLNQCMALFDRFRADAANDMNANSITIALFFVGARLCATRCCLRAQHTTSDAIVSADANVFGTSVESAGIFGPDSVVVVWALEEDAAIPEVSAIGRG